MDPSGWRVPVLVHVQWVAGRYSLVALWRVKDFCGIHGADGGPDIGGPIGMESSSAGI